jgi:hypothetical protein
MKKSFKTIYIVAILIGSAMVISGMALLFPNYKCLDENAGGCVNPLGGPLCGIGAAVIVLTILIWVHAGVRSSLPTLKGCKDTGTVRLRKSSTAEQHGPKEAAQDVNHPWDHMYQHQRSETASGSKQNSASSTNSKQKLVTLPKSGTVQ